MGLMTGTGPLSRTPAGRFNFEPPPGGALYLEPTPKRIRVVVAGEAVADSRAAMIMSETGHQPVYYFPPGDVRMDLLEPSDRRTRCPKKGEASYHSIRVGERLVESGAWHYPEPLEGAPPFGGMIAFYWSRMDQWFEEDEEVFGHPRNPYHRVDCVPTSRRLRVEVARTVVVDTTATTGVYETALAPRLYVDRSAVRGARLAPSSSTSYCPYKGTATWWDLELGDTVVHDAAWSYDDPLPESLSIRGLLAFDEARVGVTADLPPST